MMPKFTLYCRGLCHQEIFGYKGWVARFYGSSQFSRSGKKCPASTLSWRLSWSSSGFVLKQEHHLSFQKLKIKSNFTLYILLKLGQLHSTFKLVEIVRPKSLCLQLSFRTKKFGPKKEGKIFFKKSQI